jgi:4-amino-4-deoxy-L-arabinose transferase-like glycosyltransferase
MPRAALARARRWAPEATLALLAGAIVLGFLGSTDLWGKREQRASAEALDTVEHGHWLVAEIQGRPRLEKPPLPRWTTAALLRLGPGRDEWAVRLPAAAAALGTIALVYALGRRLGGREVALASALALSSTVFFVVEARQAGNDAPLAFFTTLALYAAWRRLHGDAGGLGRRAWADVLGVALGLGFLCKGPIIVLVTAATVVPYLATCRRLGEGLRALASGRGAALFALLALAWPVPVALVEPRAAGVWYLEMAQKVGTAGIKHHEPRDLLAGAWPGMTAPWTLFALAAIALPVARRPALPRPGTWFAWWWAAGNLAVFCTWQVAKPSYYLPCLPGVALLAGIAWVRTARLARAAGAGPAAARGFLQAHWVGLFVFAGVAPVIVGRLWPGLLGWSLAAGSATAIGVVLSAWLWRRGADAGALAPLVGGWAAAALVGYGAVVPRLVAPRSHRALAAELERALPAGERTVMFFHQLDEGLWFYLRDRELRPVPGSAPAFNEGFDLVLEARENRLIYDRDERHEADRRGLLAWLRDPGRGSRYCLVRAKVYDDLFAGRLEGLARPVYREDLAVVAGGPEFFRRNAVVLLRAEAPGRVELADRGAARGPVVRPLRPVRPAISTQPSAAPRSRRPARLDRPNSLRENAPSVQARSPR